MLVDAGHRTLKDAAAAFALPVDAKDDNAVAFDRRHGFRPIAERPKTRFLPLAKAPGNAQGVTYFNKSGRSRAVFSSALFFLNFRISS